MAHLVIVGMEHRDAVDYMRGVKEGEDLILRREPTNKFDPNAVMVVHGQKHVGYLKRQQAAEIAAAMDAAGHKERQATFYLSPNSKYPCLRMKEDSK